LERYEGAFVAAARRLKLYKIDGAALLGAVTPTDSIEIEDGARLKPGLRSSCRIPNFEF
jgi:hypothetical protein